MLEAIFIIFFLVIFSLMTIFIFLMVYKILRYRYFLPPITLESIKDLCCPKCTSKELELIGYRTIKCKKCAFTFNIGPSAPYSIWWFGLWPLFWVWPIFWWIHEE